MCSRLEKQMRCAAAAAAAAAVAAVVGTVQQMGGQFAE